MALRIHFTGDDLARIAVAQGPDPLWESLLSAHLVRKQEGALVFERWRRRIQGTAPPQVRPFFVVAPPWGYSPDFLTPAMGTVELEAGIDTVLSTRRSQIRTDMERLAAEQRLSHWGIELRAGSADALHQLGDGIRAFHDMAVAPHWDEIRARIDAERCRVARLLLDGGVDGMLASLHGVVRWEPPVLTVFDHPADRDLHLEGRGLRLVPSFFCWRHPLTLRDEGQSPTLVYPIEHSPGWLAERYPADDDGEYVARLIGRTRAKALRALTGSLTTTTTELAQRIGVSPASASEHATVLRDSGLIASHRLANTVQHSLTDLGRDLLNGHKSPK